MELRLDATPEELPVFLAEVDELLQRLDEQLVRLEQDGPSPELLQEVFRAAHTIKGGSAAIGHIRMAHLTHAMETLLDRVRHGELDTSPALVERLFESLDALKILAGEVATLEQTDLNVDELIVALEGLASGDAAPAVHHEVVRPSTLPVPEGATHHVLVKLEVASWAAVRALQTLMALESVGELLVSRPSRKEVERQEVNERLEAFFHSELPLGQIREALDDVSEIGVLLLEEASGFQDEVEGEGEDELAAEGPESVLAGPAVAGPRVAGDTRGQSAPRAGANRQSKGTVRIDVERLDNLLNLVGELVIDRTRLLGLGRALEEQFGEQQLLSEVLETTLHLGRVTDELQSEVMKSRMLPIGTVFSRFPRVTRDLATRQNKKIELVIVGQETELDRSVIEAIGDPLVHLLRNAIDHGIERPADRAASGKPETATVRLAAEHVENSIVITVQDDGRGIDAERVRARAVERGLISPEAAGRLSEQEATELIFAPGFSTAATITDVSGRGVGMDIVRTNVERLGGTVEVQTSLGEGSRFLLRLPLTLAIVQALLVRVGTGIYALPLTSVTETLRIPVGEIQRLQQQEAILLRGKVLPIARLSRVFRCEDAEATDKKDLMVVAVKVGERQVGLAVDRLLGEQEVVIKSLGGLIGDVAGISSAAILGDGAVALIVDVPGLVQRIAATSQATISQERSWTDARDTHEPTSPLRRSA